MATKKTKKSKKAVKKAPKTRKQTPVIAPEPPEVDLNDGVLDIGDEDQIEDFSDDLDDDLYPFDCDEDEL